MDINQIPVVTVSYNSPDLVRNLISSFRQYYTNPLYVIDGSDPEQLEQIKAIKNSFENVNLTAFGYNIHHGPGLSWAISNLPLSGPVLFLDSDITILKRGFLEAMAEVLEGNMYGVGGVACINRDGFDIPCDANAIKYLHPGCMLCNIGIMKQWPLPVKHGAPMVEAMLALHDSGANQLIRNIEWVINDVKMGTKKIFIDHKGQGTVTHTGGYHLEEWSGSIARKKQEPSKYSSDVRDYNRDLLALIPKNASRLIEIGCNAGSLAAAFKKINEKCNYLGVELDQNAAQLAGAYCDAVYQMNIEAADDSFFQKMADRDCWIFGDVLEHLLDPWGLLSKIRKIIPENGCIVACIPNAQHWSLQAKLSIGDFRYQDAGLLDRTHIRWFTRATIFELFQSTGFEVIGGYPRIFEEPMREKILPAIRLMAQSVGADPELAVSDSLAMQYVVLAKPV